MTVSLCETAAAPARDCPATADWCALRELWIALASLLRSYTEAYGVDGNRHALAEAGEARILVCRGKKRLSLERDGAIVIRMRENRSSGRMIDSDASRLCSEIRDEEMDQAAEAWAGELMR